MTIGFFSSKFPYENITNFNYQFGGSVIASYNLIKGLQKIGCNISVYTTSHNSHDSSEIVNGLRIFRYANTFDYLSTNLSLGLFYKPDHKDINLVHTSFDIPPAPFAGLLFARRKKVPFIITHHGDWDDSYGNPFRRIILKGINEALVPKLLSEAKIIISPSMTYAKKSKFLAKHINKIVQIPNGIDIPSFDIKESKISCRDRLNLPLNKKIILYLGQLTPYKSPDVLLKAFKETISHETNVILIIAGTGILKDTLIKLSKELGINEQVIFLGYINETLKPMLFRAADIFCLPSSMSTECYPLAILEAMACDLPVIASNIGGIPDLITHGETGYLVTPGDPRDLKEKFIYALKNEEANEKVSQNAKNKIKSYSWDRIAHTTKLIYDEFL